MDIPSEPEEKKQEDIKISKELQSAQSEQSPPKEIPSSENREPIHNANPKEISPLRQTGRSNGSEENPIEKEEKITQDEAIPEKQTESGGVNVRQLVNEQKEEKKEIPQPATPVMEKQASAQEIQAFELGLAEILSKNANKTEEAKINLEKLEAELLICMQFKGLIIR